MRDPSANSATPTISAGLGLRRELEHRAAVAGFVAAAHCRPVEVPVRIANQPGIWRSPVGVAFQAAETVNDRLFPLAAGLRDKLIDRPAIITERGLATRLGRAEQIAAPVEHWTCPRTCSVRSASRKCVQHTQIPRAARRRQLVYGPEIG